MGCFSRLGCLTFGVLLGAIALAAVLATRDAGPRFEEGVYSYDVAGREHEVRISSEAAREFDAKASGDLPVTALLEAATVGVPISEEELNSRVAEELAERTLERHGARVERVFIRLSATGARAYVYTTVRDVEVVLSSDLVFRVEDGRARVELRDPQAGRLPVGFLVSPALLLVDDLGGVEEAIAAVIPPQVRGFRHEEGRLRVLVSPLADAG
ncbi:MAG: hypothetical protein ACRDJE_04895 [Dehalococcoidia bacterium]